jgi:hypothetical protein
MGTGDPDLYKAFAWRFWNLAVKDGGRLGVVLPRSAFAAKGSELLRKVMLAGSRELDLTNTTNRAGWMFDEMEHRYTIGLIAVTRGHPLGKSVTLRGPFADKARFDIGHNATGAQFTAAEVQSWEDSAALPLLPTEESLGVFAQIRKAPRLDNNVGTWRARPQTELHASSDKPLLSMVADRPAGYWPVYKGESFDIWSPDCGAESYYGWANPATIEPELRDKRLRAGRRVGGGAHSEFTLAHRLDLETLAHRHPRIAFRDVTRATDSRTVRAALIPPKTLLVHLAPFLLWPKGDALDEAFLLGVLSSIPLDWYARRWVETHLTYNVLNPLPIPRPDRSSTDWKRAVALAGRLAAPDDRFADWATKVGVDHGLLATNIKQDMIDELDAVVARLYGLDAAQLTHLFETFHEGWDYAPRLAAVLAHFNRTPADPA